MAEHAAVFAALDTDGDGVVSAEEFEAAYAKKVIAGPDMGFANDPKPGRLTLVRPDMPRAALSSALGRENTLFADFAPLAAITAKPPRRAAAAAAAKVHPFVFTNVMLHCAVPLSLPH